MAVKLYTSIFNPYSNATFTALQKQTSVNIATNLRMTGVRYDLLPEVYEPTRGGTRDFTALNQVTDMVVAAGLECSLVLAFVPTGGGWVSSTKCVSAADIPYLVNSMVAGVNQVISRGQPRSKIRLEMWNEPDLTGFGAPVNGTWHRANIAFFNACASAMKANFPDIPLCSPSIGYLESSTGLLDWPSITNANCGVGGVVDSHWQYYDEFNFHMYLNLANRRPCATLADVKAYTNLAYNNLLSAISATSLISAYFTDKPICCTELGFDFNNAGMNETTNVWYWGNEKMRAQYVMKALNTLSAQSRVSLISIYRSMNDVAAYDARSNSQHYGICDSQGNPYELYVELAKRSGQNVTSSTANGTGVVNPL